MPNPDHLVRPLSDTLVEVLSTIVKISDEDKTPSVRCRAEMAGDGSSLTISNSARQGVRPKNAREETLKQLEIAGLVTMHAGNSGIFMVAPTELGRERVKYNKRWWLGKRWMELRYSADQPLSGRWQRISFFLALVVAVIQALELFGISIGGLWKLLLSQIP